jgi:hypothetical protein
MSLVDALLPDEKQLFEISNENKIVLGRIAKELIVRFPAAAAGGEGEVVAALERLFIEQVLKLPEIKKPDKVDVNKEGLVDLAENAVKAALFASGQPGLMVAVDVGADAIKWIAKKFNRCGGNDRGNPPLGKLIQRNPQNGNHVIRYFLEEKDGLPLLPAVEGSPKLARSIFEAACTCWELFLKVEIVRTETIDDANLIVTGRVFAAPTPSDVLALTDIGPPGGLAGNRPVQLRMVFDLGETYDKQADFAATAAHELGHALGIRHRDLPNPAGQLMNDTLTSVAMPQAIDLDAAVRKGWVRKV